MTDNAADVVQKIVEQNVADEQAGLRIRQAPDESLALTPVPASEMTLFSLNPLNTRIARARACKACDAAVRKK